MVTIKDISRKAGMSSATVSRVLNGKSASERTRARVLKIVQELNYTPNAIASSLRTRKNRNIGVIIPDISNPFYPASIKSFYDTAKGRGYNIILGNTYGKVSDELEILRLMARERVGGLMLETCEGEEDWVCYPFLREMAKGGTFIVLLGKKKNGLEADMISVNHESGEYKAASYLLRTGRRRIGFICGQKTVLSGEQRYAGYRKALREKGIKTEKNLVSFDGWTIESGRMQTKKMLGKEKPDALCCANDLLAIGAMDAVKEKGLDIPGDIAVTGFDDINFASFLTPKLTTVRQPIADMTSSACNILIDRIEGKYAGSFREIIIEPELIVRESA